MGILSKLFKKETERVAADILRDIINKNGNTASQQPQAYTNPSVAQVNQPVPSKPAKASPSGFSWGDTMPDEENQFNFKGSYVEYFDGIFRTEFPQYRLECEAPRKKATVFTFYSGTQKALVVELLASSSASKKLRMNCAEQRIPYLRFYYDHHGWWNTRSYVITRTRNALKL